MSYFHAALDGFYQLRETIGSGGFAKVKAAYHVHTGEKVAIKIMNKAELGDDLPRVQNEIEALKSIQHQNICELYQILETAERYYIVMEYCPGGELFDYIVEQDKLDEAEARKIFRQILSAVGYLHAQGFAHRDLKPENCLIGEDNSIKLIDFGLCARPGATGILQTCCGSPAYAAPELVAQQEYLGSAADVWSLGVLLYALLCGFLPFEDSNLPALYRKIQKGVFECPSWLSSSAWQILTCMMHTDPLSRITIPELCSHPWVTNLGTEPQVFCTSFKSNVLEDEATDACLSELALYCRRPKREILNTLSYSRYDYLTATFLILKRRSSVRGLPARLEGFGTAISPLLSSLIPQSHFDCSLLEEKPIPRKQDNNKILTRPSPLSQDSGNQPCIEVVTPAKPQRPYSACLLDSDKENFAVPMTPVRQARGRTKPSPDNVLSPSRSMESSLHSSDNSASPQTPRTPRSVFGSLERLGGRLKTALTPRKKAVPGGDNGPRKVSAVAHNVTTTEECHPQAVLNKLFAALVERKIQVKQTGYLLRCQVCDDWGKPQLAFDLEVCLVSRQEGIGVRRKRVKGDSWHYKRLCEDVLHAAQLH